MKNVAVVLSGCGVMDGSEIYEATLTLLALDKANLNAICTAPNKMQYDVVNHLTGKPDATQKRNVLVEAARLARGKITPLNELDLNQVQAIIFPGGFGVAKNLSSYANEEGNYSVDPDIEAFLKKARKVNKVMGFICIAPLVAAKVFGKDAVKLTIGNDPATAQDIQKTGAKHEACSVGNIVFDGQHNIVSTPAYMLGRRISEVQEGINKLVDKIAQLIK